MTPLAAFDKEEGLRLRVDAANEMEGKLWQIPDLISVTQTDLESD